MSALTGRPRWLVAALVAATSAAGAAPAHAQDVSAKLTAYEREVRQLATDLPRPNRITGAAGQRRLVDAEVAFALGDYDTASLMLFELAAKPGADQLTASYYLAESLFQKGDRGAARGYYEHVVVNSNVSNRYYQPSLQRLIEIAIAQRDDTGVAEHLVALDRISAGLRLPSVPYVRGKLAFSRGKHDEAIAYFQEVPKGSDVELQAAYYMGTTYVARKDLQRATEIFDDLIARKPRTAADRRVIELSQLALGRLYYERDQHTKAIDSYLLVDRHSDLFPDALYEVAWVYVKAKQFDKALRALELLALSDPQSTKTPTVRILEGNLRLRKAQMLRTALIQGTLDTKEQASPAAEYDKAAQVFAETHDMYVPSYAALSRMVDSGASPVQYLAQIAGRSPHVFQTAAPIPEAAVQYLRDEPEVQRVVAVESDLGVISADIAEAETTIARLQGVLAARDRTVVYPRLALRRSRAEAIGDELIKIRSDLADQQLKLVAGTGELTQLSARRRQAVGAVTAMPSAGHVASERLAQNQAGYDAIEQTASEVDDAIGSTQAIAVALRKYANDTPELSADRRQQLADALDAAARDARGIETELARVHREIQLGRDLAGVGDESMAAASEARRQARAAADAEHKALAGFAGSSRDRGQSQRLVALADRATKLAGEVADATRQIDAAVDDGLKEVKGLLAQEIAKLEAFKAELEVYEAESRAIGGGVLGATFKNVKAKFYDIIIRTDVGNVDVAWSQKEDSDDDLKRLNLSRQRELKQLRDEFRDILEAGTTKPSSPSKPEAPAAPPPPPSGSPDKAPGEQRVTPGGDRSATPARPTVQPDAVQSRATQNRATPNRATPNRAAPAAPKADARKGAAKGGSGGAKGGSR
jgi:tetratricopeptide (TPR) repeat protein